MRKTICRLALLVPLTMPVGCIFAVGTHGWDDEEDIETRVRRLERRVEALEHRHEHEVDGTQDETGA